MPTPTPSISCPTARPIYRLNLADWGGDGWQGASYRVYNASDYPNIAMRPSLMVANGTLTSGFSGVDWLCLADGCYEIIVDGGAADSEIGFEFVDEVGGHFQDFSAPYADHMCVSGGDVFDHPTASPSTLPPTQAPTEAPTPAPSAIPMPSPITLPTTLPTAFPMLLPTPLLKPSSIPAPAPTPVSSSALEADGADDSAEAVVAWAVIAVAAVALAIIIVCVAFKLRRTSAEKKNSDNRVVHPVVLMHVEPSQAAGRDDGI